MGAYTNLDDWINGIGINLLAVEYLEGENGFEPNFTGASLESLEQAMASYFGGPEDFDNPDVSHLAYGAAGYLGEALMRLAGGSWGWRGGEPYARADKALDLAPAYPVRLLAQAVSDLHGRVFSEVYETWAAAVAQHRAANPQWTPKKKPTPGIDPYEMEPADAAFIAAWASERRNTFPQWEKTYGADVTWDFSPTSLDTLESILLRVTPLPENLDDPAYRTFTEGAVWYLGEAIRRIRGGAWAYRTPDPEIPNIYAGDPYVHPTGRDSQLVMPIVVLHDFVRNREPGTLRDAYTRCADEVPEAR